MISRGKYSFCLDKINQILEYITHYLTVHLEQHHRKRKQEDITSQGLEKNNHK